MGQPAMPEQIGILHTEAKPDHIEIGRDGEDCSHKPQMPRHARAVEECGNGAGRDDVRWGRSHQTVLNEKPSWSGRTWMFVKSGMVASVSRRSEARYVVISPMTRAPAARAAATPAGASSNTTQSAGS